MNLVSLAVLELIPPWMLKDNYSLIYTHTDTYTYIASEHIMYNNSYLQVGVKHESIFKILNN